MLQFKQRERRLVSFLLDNLQLLSMMLVTDETIGPDYMRPVRTQIGLQTDAYCCLHETGLKNHLACFEGNRVKCWENFYHPIYPYSGKGFIL